MKAVLFVRRKFRLTRQMLSGRTRIETKPEFYIRTDNLMRSIKEVTSEKLIFGSVAVLLLAAVGFFL
jgi:hypothetical protein